MGHKSARNIHDQPDAGEGGGAASMQQLRTSSAKGSSLSKIGKREKRFLHAKSGGLEEACRGRAGVPKGITLPVVRSKAKWPLPFRSPESESMDATL
jgi:hypothetical protein